MANNDSLSNNMDNSTGLENDQSEGDVDMNENVDAAKDETFKATVTPTKVFHLDLPNQPLMEGIVYETKVECDGNTDPVAAILKKCGIHQVTTKPVVAGESENGHDPMEEHEADGEERKPEESTSSLGEPKSAVDLKPKQVIHLQHPNYPVKVEGVVYEAKWNGNVDPISAMVQKLGLKEGNEEDTLCPRQSSPKAKKYYCAFGGGDGGSNGGGGAPKKPTCNLKFSDCGGLERQIEFIRAAVLGPLSGEDCYKKRFGLEAPKGILFFGPPGTGKTRLAQALGNEVSQLMKKPVHFIYRKGQDVASRWFGRSSEKLREVFDEAIEMQPTILFFDEIDGLCPSRDSPCLNQANITIVTTMLGLMDELPQGEVFVVGATNRVDAVDPALRRPGRFDKHLEFNLPDEPGRLRILEIHTNKWKRKPDEELLYNQSSKTVGFSGADLSKLCLDAFDNALNRAITGSQSYKDMSFSKLDVEVEDWDQAFNKMRPSNSAVYGSTQYIPSAGLGDHLEPIFRSSILNVVEAIRTSLAKAARTECGRINMLYVWTACELHSENIEDLIVAPALKSGQLGQVSTYTFSAETLLAVCRKGWGKKISDALNQALNAPSSPSILYLKDVIQLSNIINSDLGLLLSLKQKMEELRGKSVVLLASGPVHPRDIQGQKGEFFKKLLLSDPSGILTLGTPAEEERYEFFTQVFEKGVLDDTWDDDEIERIIEDAVIATENRSIGSIVLLYDTLHQTVISANDANAKLQKLSAIISAYIKG